MSNTELIAGLCEIIERQNSIIQEQAMELGQYTALTQAATRLNSGTNLLLRSRTPVYAAVSRYQRDAWCVHPVKKGVRK